MTYQPSKGDLRFRDAKRGDTDPFETAILLRGVSREYLLVLIHDNSGDRSKPFRAMLEAELAHRGASTARRANTISLIALIVAAASLLVAFLK
jgi:hypothetical protein